MLKSYKKKVGYVEEMSVGMYLFKKILLYWNPVISKYSYCSNVGIG